MEDPVLTQLPRQRPLHRPHLDLPPAHTTVSSLYPEILALIFSYLDVKDKGSAAQVCLAWRDASYQKSVWRGTEAKLHLRRTSPPLYHSLVRRGIKKVQVLSLRRSLREVVQGIPNLESLNLSGCFALSDIALSHAIYVDLLALTTLDLSLCKQITDQSLAKIATHLKNLEVLELGGCSNITNNGVLPIAWSLKKLIRLNLRSCWYISDQGIGYLAGVKTTAEGNLKLEHLSLQGCQKISDESLRHISQGLPRLQSLNLSFCINISDTGLKHLAKMAKLKELNLRACDNISDLGVAYLSEGGSLTLSELDMSFCDKVSDNALFHLSQGLFNLRALSMSGCQISDEGMICLAKTLHELEILNIGQCHGVTDMGLMQMADSLTNLRFIDLYGCTKITSAGLERVMKMPQLSNLNLRLWHYT